MKECIQILSEKRLKITPQRIVVLDALIRLKNHPSAENVINYIKAHHPAISTATIYNNLDTFIEKGIIRKVKTGNDIMRYDAIEENHHHLYSTDSERIEDYCDDDLNNILKEYFKNKKIPNFNIENIELQIIGRFTDKLNTE
jgi:Fur family peroxide stress response transcriptional regulator